MLKKLKQKKQLLLASLIAIIGINLLGFIPYFANGQAADCTTFDPTSPKTYASRVYVDKTDTTDPTQGGKADRDYAIGQANTNGPRTQILNLNEPLKIYMEAKLPAEYSNCGNELKNSFKFAVWLYTGQPGQVPFPVSLNASFDSASQTFFATVNPNSWPEAVIDGTSTVSRTGAYVYFCKNDGCSTSDINGNDYIERFYVMAAKTPENVATVIPPSRPLLQGGSTQNPDNVVKAENVKLKFTNGLKDKYRLLYTETGAFTKLQFGSNGLTPINVEWGDPNQILTLETPMSIPSKNFNVGFYPYFKNIIVGLNYSDAVTKDTVCESRTFTEICDNVVFYSTNANGKESDPKTTLPGNGFNPFLNNIAWQKGIDQNKSVTEGQPLGTVKFKAVPIIWSEQTASQSWFSYVFGTNTAEFTIEVYKTQADIQKACENDANVTDKSICTDPAKMRFDVGKTIETTAGTNQTTGGGKTLYDFIIEVIAYIVIGITTVIYWIFATVLVPVLNALIRIHPFRDTFVNVVYPGWLIMRNLANIAFIIALLVMGLMTLFQVSNANKTRGMIVWLILMALLVNFSLVIAQAVVAIADTVQSQFLPGNSQVIEALGKAIMADPALAIQKNFGDVSTAATSNLFGPIMLLITSVAGFFAFVAITAFVAIRTVALWVFYLTSPFAYFGQVLDQTRGAAKQWWQQFLKYAFMVPILAFFLNIAALMAGTLDKQSTINPQAASGLYSDQAIASVEGITLTIISQVVVLIFLFAGMKIASGSGTYGAKAITNFAQKGFKNALTKWPGTAKDIAADWAARGANRINRPGLAKAITAAAKPLDLAAATKKKWMDDASKERKDRQAKLIGDIPVLTRSTKDSGKLGASLKGAKAKVKDFERDDADYLGSRMAEGYNKGDRDTLAGAMLKMGQEGHFKDMLAEASHLTGKTYAEDAAGLNDMTADMVKKGKLSESNRTDLLDEFDRASKKQRKNVHYGGNTSYDRASDKTVVRQRDPRQNDGFATANPANPYQDDKSWTRSQIKARTGSDAKGSLKKDLTEAHQNAAVKNGQLTDAQIGVFAHSSLENLNDRKIWNAAEAAQEEKMEAMRNVFRNEDNVQAIRQKMIQYYEAVPTAGGSVGTAEEKADARVNILRNQLFNRANATQQAGQGNQNQIGFIRNNQQNQNQPTTDEDEDEDEEPQASVGGTTTVVASSASPITSAAATMNAQNRVHSDEVRNPIGDPVFGSQQNNLSRGSASINNSEKGKQSEGGKAPKRTQAGFTGGVGGVKPGTGIGGDLRGFDGTNSRLNLGNKEDEEDTPPTTDQPSPTPA